MYRLLGEKKNQLSEPQDTLPLGLGPLLCRNITENGTCMGESVTSTKFTILPHDYFSLSFSLDILSVLWLLQIFSFKALLAPSPTHELHCHLPLASTGTTAVYCHVIVCHLEALLALSNTHILHSISSPHSSFVFLSPLWPPPCFSLFFRPLPRLAPHCPSFGHIPPLFSGLQQPTVDCHPLYGTHGTSRGTLSETCSPCMVQNKWETP